MAQAIINEYSAGGVVMRGSRGHNEICLVLRNRHGLAAWSLPKGHINALEDPSFAALREVKEETGFNAEIVSALGTITYQFKRGAVEALVNKSVTFFMMGLTSAEQKPYDMQEVVQVKWVPIDEALSLVSYENERRILRKAKRMFGTHRRSVT